MYNEKLNKQTRMNHLAPSVAEWSKAPEFDAETGGESPVQAPVWAVTFSPYV